MATIPQFTSRRPTLDTGARTLPRARITSAVGQQVQKLGQTVSAVGTELTREQQKQEGLDVAFQFRKLQNELSNGLDESSTTISDPNTFTGNFIDKSANPMVDKFLSNVPPRLRGEFSARSKILIEDVKGRANKVANRELNAQNQLKIESITDSLSANVTEDPNTFGVARSALFDRINELQVPKSVKEEIKRKNVTRLLQSAVQGHIARGEFDEARSLVQNTFRQFLGRTKKRRLPKVPSDGKTEFTRDNAPTKFFRARELFNPRTEFVGPTNTARAVGPQVQSIDAPSLRAIDTLGKRFFDETGIRLDVQTVPKNIVTPEDRRIGAIDLNKPLIKDAKGNLATERTITIQIDTEDGEQFVNIPTIVNGKQVTGDQAVNMFMDNKNVAVSGPFNTKEEAFEVAKSRSDLIAQARGLSDKPVAHVDGKAVEFDFSKITKRQKLLLARLVQAEAGNEPIRGQIAVLNVVMNRVAQGRGKGTIEGVVNEPRQFEPVLRGKLPLKPRQEIWDLVNRWLDPRVYKDITNGADHFLNENITNQRGTNFLRKNPKGFRNVEKIGNHTFARSVSAKSVAVSGKTFRGTAFEINTGVMSDGQKANFVNQALDMGFNRFRFEDGRVTVAYGEHGIAGEIPEWARSAIGTRFPPQEVFGLALMEEADERFVPPNTSFGKIMKMIDRNEADKEDEIGKKENEVRSETAKQATTLLIDGELTREWIETHKDRLSSSNFDKFMRAVDKGNKASERSQTFNQYLEKIDNANGDRDALDGLEDDILDALANGEINVTVFRQLTRSLRSERGETGIPSWVKIRRNVLKTKLRPLDREDREQRIKQLEGLEAYDDQIRSLASQDKLTRDSVSRIITELERQFQAAQKVDHRAKLPTSKFLSKGKYAVEMEDVNEAARKVILDFRSNKINKDEMTTQTRILKQWFDALKREQDAGR